MSAKQSNRLSIPVQDLTGQKFGLLFVLTYIRGGKWFCRCDCGKYTAKAATGHLSSGHTQSCGCGAGEAHGGSKLPEYQTWLSMKARCLNLKTTGYKNYGGRGITICQRWLDSFAAFYEDMGAKPSPKHQLNRIDNDGNYEPSNCKWTTKQEQMRNTRNNRLLTYRNTTMTLAEWAEMAGATADFISDRLKLGWTLHEAVTIPPYERRKEPQ